MSTFIVRTEPRGGLRVAVKDVIDVVGLPTTAGCRAVERRALPAVRDAACLAGFRAAEARGEATLIGKVNLHELALGPSGINPWFGMPPNPLDPRIVPGGSSSGSASVVGSGEADVSFGTDTAGFVRIPAACCGTTGLKTTWGRIPLHGVYPLSPSLDTVGPMARDVGAVIRGMELLEPSFTPAATAPTAVGRLRLPGVDPAIDAAVDRALAEAEFEVVDVEIPGWYEISAAAASMLLADAWATNRRWLEVDPDGVGLDVAVMVQAGATITDEALRPARATAERWRAQLAEVFTRVQLVATPTLTEFPPAVEQADRILQTACTMPPSFAGVRLSHCPSQCRLARYRPASSCSVHSGAKSTSSPPGCEWKRPSRAELRSVRATPQSSPTPGCASSSPDSPRRPTPRSLASLSLRSILERLPAQRVPPPRRP